MDSKMGRMAFLGALAAGGGAFVYSRQSREPAEAPGEKLRVLLLQGCPGTEPAENFPMLQETEFDKLMDLLYECKGTVGFGILGDTRPMQKITVDKNMGLRKFRTERANFRNQVVRRMKDLPTAEVNIGRTLRDARSFLSDTSDTAARYLVVYTSEAQVLAKAALPQAKTFLVNYNPGTNIPNATRVEGGEEALREIRKEIRQKRT
jgi:hypothetical protein